METKIEELTPTPAEDIAEPEKNVQLEDARTRGGEPVVFRVRLVEYERLMTLLGGMPFAAETPGEKVEETWAQKVERAVAAKEPSANIAKAGVVSPLLSFGEEREPGKWPWWNVSAHDQGLVIAGIIDISGLGNRRTAPLREFPAGVGGRDNGGAGARGGDGGSDAGAGTGEGGAAESHDLWPQTQPAGSA